MTVMEYGSAYLRPRKDSDDDGTSMLSSPAEASQYQAYRPEQRRQSSSSQYSLPSRSSWIVLQQALPPMPIADDNRTSVRPSLFSSRANIDSIYTEQVAWANSTNFQTSNTRSESPKPEVTTTMNRLSGSGSPKQTRKYFRNLRHVSEPWSTGFWKRFPWIGLGALFSAILLTGASAGLLIASDKTTLKSWRIGSDDVHPHVYISILEMVTNFLMFVALFEGVAIRFWRRMMGGSTLSNIHDIYDSAFIWRAVMRIFKLRYNIVAVACILAALSASRGPLFQRALTVSEHRSNANVSTALRIAPLPIPEYFQSHSTDPRFQGGLSTDLDNILGALRAGNQMSLAQSIPECGESCEGTLKTFTFNVSCESSFQPFDLISLPDDCTSCKDLQCQQRCDGQLQRNFSPTFFSINYSTNTTNDQEQSLVLTSVWKDEPSCAGDVKVQTCTLTYAKSDVQVTISNGNIDRRSDDTNTTTNSELVTVDKQVMQKYMPLAFEALFLPVAVNVTPTNDFTDYQYRRCTEPRERQIGSDGSPDLTSCTNGTTPETSLRTDPSLIYATTDDNTADELKLCNLTWRNPMPDMIAKMQDLAFRITLDMAQGDGSVFAPTYENESLTTLRSSWNQILPVTAAHTSIVYETNSVLVAIGALVSLVGVVAVIPLYSGFQDLGRKISLNPLEIARAFGAPLLEGVDGNATSDAVVMERGGMAVRYGVLERFGDEKKLRVEESARANVRVPWHGEVFG